MVSIGQRVSVADGLFSGIVIGADGHELVVELDGQFDELPTDACYFSERRTVLWPCWAEEVEIE